jgi:hypothetical protein
VLGGVLRSPPYYCGLLPSFDFQVRNKPGLWDAVGAYGSVDMRRLQYADGTQSVYAVKHLKNPSGIPEVCIPPSRRHVHVPEPICKA